MNKPEQAFLENYAKTLNPERYESAQSHLRHTKLLTAWRAAELVPTPYLAEPEIVSH